MVIKLSNRWAWDWRSRFHTCRCTIECDLGHVIHTHCPTPLKLRSYEFTIF